MDHLNVMIGRERLERAALAYHAALSTRHPGTIAEAVRELGCAADAFGVASDDARRTMEAMAKLQEAKR